MSTTGRKRPRPQGRHMPSLRGVPLLPRDADGPVFTSPWEARAFAIVVLLYQQGHFTWQEWVNALSAEIAAAKAAGRADYGSAYYELWLTAAEKLLTAKGMFLEQELRHKKAALTTEYA